jgi:hypothetical protein
MPHYPRQHTIAPPDVDITESKKWHSGLLDLGSKRNSPRLNGAKFFRNFVPASLRGESDEPESTNSGRMDTDYVLSQASKRLQEVPPVQDDRSLSTISENAGGDGVPLSVPHRKKSMTALPDTEYGRETLRDRRKGMRDNWLDGLFAVRAPGTENLVILEQRDGSLRGASVGGAIVPETIPATDFSSPPRRAEEVVLRGSVPKRVEVQPKSSKIQSCHEVASQVSGDGYEADLSHGCTDNEKSKENINTTAPASVGVKTAPASLRFKTAPSTHAAVTEGGTWEQMEKIVLEMDPELQKRLQEAVDELTEDDALRLHLVPSLDGGVNTPVPWELDQLD